MLRRGALPFLLGSFLCLFALAGLNLRALLSTTDDESYGNEDPSITLRQAAQERNLLVGACAFPEGLKEEAYATFLAREFNVLTPENAMKWENIHPQPKQWNFGPADQLVDFAAKNEMKVTAHVLVWHLQLPEYLKALSASNLRQALREHIQETVGHFKGKVYAWDVVNEAIDHKAGLRKTIFLEKLGEGYIAEAFRAAHEADPGALLFYNDYDCDGMGPKSDRQFNLLRQLLVVRCSRIGW